MEGFFGTPRSVFGNPARSSVLHVLEWAGPLSLSRAHWMLFASELQEPVAASLATESASLIGKSVCSDPDSIAFCSRLTTMVTDWLQQHNCVNGCPGYESSTTRATPKTSAKTQET